MTVVSRKSIQNESKNGITNDFLNENILSGSTKVCADIPGVTKSYMTLFDILEKYRIYLQSK